MTAPMTAPVWDPQMRAAHDAMARAAQVYPPMRLEAPFGQLRAINEALNLPLAAGGPVMADTDEHWVPAQGRRVLYRVYRPLAGAALPAMIYLHGGGWVLSSIDTHDRLARQYAAAGGVAAILVDYALAPEARFPTALLECAEIVRHVARHGAEWGVDGSRIVLAGDSAGGNLALATALLLREEGAALCGILAAYPATDLRLLGTPTCSGDEYGLSFDDMRAYRDLYLRDAIDRLHPLASPLLAECARLPPTLIQLAELDPLRPEGEAMAARLHAAGIATTLHVTPGVLHGFLRLGSCVDAATAAADFAGPWLRQVTSPLG